MQQQLVELGRRIRTTRELRSMSQEELAARVGINNSFLSQLERGLKAPSLKTLFRIAEELEVQPGHLFAAEEEATRVLVDQEVARLLGEVSPRARKKLVELLRVGVGLAGHRNDPGR